MNLLKELNLEKNNLFQFYIIVGDGKKNKNIVLNFLKKEFSFNEKDNFYSISGDDFLIDKTRDLKKENSIIGNTGKKIIFLDFKKINIDAQNALLKTFEDTLKNSHIFLFLPSDNFLLDTIKSRGRIIFGEKKYDLELAKNFIDGSFLEREKIIQKIDKINISIFMDSLEFLMLESKNMDREFYKNFLELKKYIFDKGASVKNILIWIAINLK